jgi:hypothetical protein
MSGIIIEKAPESYQRYLTIGDAKGNFNKKVDTKEEAKISAEEFCKEKGAEDCQKFLEFLDKSHFIGTYFKAKVLFKSSSQSWSDNEIDSLVEFISKTSPEFLEKLISALSGILARKKYGVGKIDLNLEDLIVKHWEKEYKKRISEVLVDKSADIKIRNLAAYLLGVIKDSGAKAALKRVLGVGLFVFRDKNEDLCQIAFRSLKRIREKKNE